MCSYFFRQLIYDYVNCNHVGKAKDLLIPTKTLCTHTLMQLTCFNLVHISSHSLSHRDFLMVSSYWADVMRVINHCCSVLQCVAPVICNINITLVSMAVGYVRSYRELFILSVTTRKHRTLQTQIKVKTKYMGDSVWVKWRTCAIS